MNNFNQVDPEIANLIKKEAFRQNNSLSLIASENYVPQAIIEAGANILTNKYAEGYPGKRYYAGCAIVDEIESIAIDRCKKLFGAEHANVQPHAGCQANMAALFGLIKPGDTLMGMSLISGGHLTHGHSVNFSGSLYKTMQYGVCPDTQLLDYDSIEELANIHKPKIIIAGASAYSRIIDFERFAKIASSVGAYLMADIAHISGLIAAGLHPNPAGIADCVTSTTHKTLRGPRGAFIICKKQYAEAIDRAIIPGSQGGPILNTIAAKAVAFKLASEESFKIYQRQVLSNAADMCLAFKSMGGYKIISDMTENHLFILDLRTKKINGYQAEQLLESIGICVSRSCIPFDTEKPWLGSGIRIGTPAVTTRGMGKIEMQELAEIIDLVITNSSNIKVITSAREKIGQLCKRYPVDYEAYISNTDLHKVIYKEI